MSYVQDNAYGFELRNVMTAPLEERLDFLRKTYGHLTGAIVAFIALSYGLFAAGIGESMLNWAMESGRFGWLMILGGFVLVGWLAQSLARAPVSSGVAYLGLALYVVAEAFIFAPMIYFAGAYAPGALPQAAVLTIAVFLALSVFVFTTKKDFSWMGPMLTIGGMIALGAIVFGAVFGFSLGLGFSVLMAIFASACVVYSTWKVMKVYQPGDHVAASLELFAAIALLFWYVLRIILAMRR